MGEGICKSGVRSVMLLGSETQCQREHELAEKVMIRAMCGIKSVENGSGRELMNLLGLEDTLSGLPRAREILSYGHVLRRMITMCREED